MIKNVSIYTDGACRGNPGPGGWGALLRYGKREKKLYGAESHTTNNRMELMAAINALAALRQSCKVDLYTDSQYLQKGVIEWMPKWKTNRWKTSNKKSVKNIDLWHQLDHYLTQHQVTWHWVKGHSGHIENELADALANQAIDELLKQEK
jgi:ribonuclease HI